MLNVKQDGSVWVWKPGATPATRVTSQFPTLPTDPKLRGYEEVQAGGLTGVPITNEPGYSMAEIMKLFGSRSSGTGASDVLARDKFNYEKQQDAKKASGLSDYYTGGSYSTGFDALLKMIADQSKVSEGAIGGAYDRALQNIGQGYDVAKGLGDKGYETLNAYLTANQNNPYAGMKAQSGVAPDALTNWLSSYGVSDQPVQGQIAADALQATQGTANYQNLIDTLSSIAQQGAGSRGAESEMAQLLFNTGLGQERAGYTSQAENARAAALAALQQAMFQSRFGVEQNRNTLAQQLAQTVAELTGAAPTSTTPTTSTTSTTPTTSTAPTAPTAPPFVSTSYDVNRPVAPPISPLVAQQLANLHENARGQDAQELLDALNARRGR